MLRVVDGTNFQDVSNKHSLQVREGNGAVTYPSTLVSLDAL